MLSTTAGFRLYMIELHFPVTPLPLPQIAHYTYALEDIEPYAPN